MPMSLELQTTFSGATEMHNLFLAIQKERKEELRRNVPNSLFLLLYDLTMEHHGALLTLVKTELHTGSAFALLRPLLEASLRGIWAKRCADREHLEQIAKGKREFPGLAAIWEAVNSTLAELGANDILGEGRAYIKQLHGLTHGGLEALIYRLDTNGQVTPNYPDSAVQLLLKQATSFTCLMAIAHSQVVIGSWEEAAPNTVRIGDCYASVFPRDMLQ